MVAVLHHEVNAVLSENRGASSRSTGHGKSFGKDFVAGACIEACVVAGDPLEGVFAQEAVIDIAEDDHNVGVLHFFGDLIFVEKVAVYEFGLRENIAPMPEIGIGSTIKSIEK